MLALTTAALLLSVVNSLLLAARASPCLAMDANFNLLVLGLGGKDFNAGTQDTWTGNTPATDITATGRPPFDGANTTCYLSQFTNAVYALSADASNPSAVYIYDAAAKTWSMQAVTVPPGPPTFDPANFKAILDHDTNVFYALSSGELFFLDMGALKAANSSALAWVDVGKPSFDTTGYDPVMALAQNHIHFLDVPSLAPGQADIFVIHFSFFQPDAQPFPTTGGGAPFPQTHGQTTSFFQTSGVQQEFAYIPDAGAATYVLNVETNTTQALAGPPTANPGAQYFAGVTALVQMAPGGALSFLPYTQGNDAANAVATWTKISTVTVPPAGSGSSSTPAGTGTKTATGTGTAKPSLSAGAAQGAASMPASSGSARGAGSTTAHALASLVGCVLLAALLL